MKQIKIKQLPVRFPLEMTKNIYCEIRIRYIPKFQINQLDLNQSKLPVQNTSSLSHSKTKNLKTI